ncbi:MAG: hypothetical protein IJS78_01370 [Clostridia bacterium]|nr:hypothetical protein [Clostridia bacterium]
MKRIAAFLLISLVLSALLTVSAGAAGTVDLSHIRQNERGAGYYWDNINDTLNLKNTNLITDDDFGFKLPAGATVVVEGNCRVRAGRFGISCLGSVTFKGTGTLTVEGGECGMYFYSTNRDHKILFLSGEYDVRGGECGIRSDGAEISICGGKARFEGPDAMAGVEITISGCDCETAGRIFASHRITVSGANLSASAENGPALVSDGRIEIVSERIETGDPLNAVDEYGGESRVTFTSTYKRVRTSMLFGGSVPGFVDVIVFAAAGLAAVAAVAVPVAVKTVRKKRLLKKLGE